MNQELQQYVEKVEAFEIDPGDKRLDFTGRLARENNWSYRLSERVIFEYKRFCILAMRSGHRVTPSEFVDQAWHLHLTYGILRAAPSPQMSGGIRGFAASRADQGWAGGRRKIQGLVRGNPSQLRAFFWAKSPQRYLAFLKGAFCARGFMEMDQRRPSLDDP